MIDALIRSAFIETRNTPDGEPLKLDASQFLTQVAARLKASAVVAVRHPLGFIKIDLTELAGAETGYECRLHVWSGNYQRNDGLGSVHDHSWELTSAVLFGELIDTNLNAIPVPSGKHTFVRVSYRQDGFDFQPAGRCDLAVQKSRRVKSPSVYRLAANVLHCTKVCSESAVTLAIADRRTAGPDRPLVSVQGHLPPRAHGPRDTVESREASDALTKLAAQIDSQPT